MKKIFIKIYDKLTNRLKNNIIKDFSELKNAEVLNEINEIKFKLDLLLKESNYPKYDSLLLNESSHREKPKILFTGFYGGGNLGDDLMLETLLEKIDKSKFDITIMLSTNEQCDVTRYKDVNLIYIPVKIYEIHLIEKHYDAVICAGGAILDDWYYLLENYHMTFTTAIINLLNCFATNEKMIIVYGVSSNNKLTNKDYIQKLGHVIENSAHFSLRDENSLYSLKQAGINTDKIEIVDDIVFGSEKLLEKRKSGNKSKYKIMISFNLQEDTKEESMKVVKTLIKYLDKKNIEDYEICLFPYFTYKNWDIPFLENIVDKINDKRVYIGEACYNFDDLLKTIDEYDYFISTRYHIALIINLIGRNFLLLNYDKHRHYKNKNKYLYDNYSFDKNIINLSNLNTLENKFDNLFKENKKKEINKKLILNASNKQKDVLSILNSLIDKK